MRIIMWPIFHLILKPLILRNYRDRQITKACERLGADKPYPTSDGGAHPDEWYWADRIAVKYGYLLKIGG